MNRCPWRIEKRTETIGDIKVETIGFSGCYGHECPYYDELNRSRKKGDVYEPYVEQICRRVKLDMGRWRNK